MTPFTNIKIRTGAAVICEQHVALIRRVKNGVQQYTLPDWVKQRISAASNPA